VKPRHLSYEQAIAHLDSCGPGIKPDLSRMKALVDLLDDPQANYPVVHVAGTNGKSTTARMTAAILAAHGLKAGVYVSPHLQSVRERFELKGLIDGAVVSSLITPDHFAEVTSYLLPFVETVESQLRSSLTYHELLTCIAFEWMTEAAVAVGVVETGLGGTWDASNVVTGQVAVMTPIDVDHAEFLGDTPEANAAEKAGIIKQGAAVVSAAQAPGVSEVLRVAALKSGAELAFMGDGFDLTSDDPAVGGRLVDVKGLFSSYQDVFLPLYGKHQSANLALAIAASESLLQHELDIEAVRVSVADMVAPARMEVVSREPLVLIDGAHNPHGGKALAEAMSTTFGARRVTAVVSMMKDKDAQGFLMHLATLADRIVLTRMAGDRAADPKELSLLPALRGIEVEVIEDLSVAIDSAIAASLDDDAVLITGSLAFAGQARDRLVGTIK